MDIPTDELIRALRAMIDLVKASGLTLKVDDGEDLDLYDERGWLATLGQVEVNDGEDLDLYDERRWLVTPGQVEVD